MTSTAIRTGRSVAMQAREIAVTMPEITVDDHVATALRVMVLRRLPGLIVVDDDRHPVAVLPATQVLRLAVPTEFQEDPALIRTVVEEDADAFWRTRAPVTIAECLPEKKQRPAVVKESATVLEVAALMARTRSPLVGVVDGEGRLIGAVTVERLLTGLAIAGLDG